MVIEAVHGLETTSITMNARFSLLTAPPKPRKKVRQSTLDKKISKNMKLLEQMARRLHQKDDRSALQKRLDCKAYGLRHFGSEENLSKPQHSRRSVYGSLDRGLSQNGIHQSQCPSPIQWRGSTGNLSLSASRNNLSQGAGPRRGRGIWRGLHMRGRFRNNPQGFRSITDLYPSFQRNRVQRARGQIRTRRGMGRGAKNQPKQIPTKEELDAQLDHYMSCTKSALDKELDAYMRNAAAID